MRIAKEGAHAGIDHRAFIVRDAVDPKELDRAATASQKTECGGQFSQRGCGLLAFDRASIGVRSAQPESKVGLATHLRLQRKHASRKAVGRAGTGNVESLHAVAAECASGRSGNGQRHGALYTAIWSHPDQASGPGARIPKISFRIHRRSVGNTLLVACKKRTFP